MSYSQYRQYDGSGHGGHGKLPSRSFVISNIKSLAASEDGEHHTQDASLTGSSSSIHPYNRQPFSSARRKSKMGRMPTAPLPTRKPNFKFTEEEENQEVSEETTTEKENSTQHAPSAEQLSSLSTRHIARKHLSGNFSNMHPKIILCHSSPWGVLVHQRTLLIGQCQLLIPTKVWDL